VLHVFVSISQFLYIFFLCMHVYVCSVQQIAKKANL